MIDSDPQAAGRDRGQCGDTRIDKTISIKPCGFNFVRYGTLRPRNGTDGCVGCVGCGVARIVMKKPVSIRPGIAFPS